MAESGEDQHKEINDHAAAPQESSGLHGTAPQESSGLHGTAPQESSEQHGTAPPGILATTWNSPPGILGRTWNSPPGILGTTWNNPPGILGTTWNSVPGILRTTWNSPPGILGTTWNRVPEILGNTWNSPPGILGTTWNSSPGILGTTWNRVPGILGNTQNSPPGILGTTWNSPLGIIRTTWNSPQESSGHGTGSQELLRQLGTAPQGSVGQDGSQQENQAETIATSVSEVERTVAAVQIRQSENPGTPVTALTASTNMRPSGASQTHEDRPRSMVNTVEAWRKEDIYITKGVEAVKEKISSKGCVCVIGVPGAGKSTALHHAALSLDGFIIYCVNGPDEFLKYYDSNNSNKKQVFVLDDALGVYSVDQGKVKSWQEQNEKVRNALGTNTKLLVSIRTQIFRHETIRDKNIVFLDKSETTDHVNYSDADYKLGIDDMRGMLTYYMKNKGTDPDNIDKVIEQVWGYTEKQLTEMTEDRRQREMSRYTAGVEFADCFPLLCRVFVTDPSKNPREFFTNPFPALTKVFQNIKTDNKHQFCALVLCAVFDGKLNSDMFSPICEFDKELDKNDVEIRNVIMTSCDVEGQKCLPQIKSALNSLDGVYVTRVENTYKMTHAVFHDVVTYLFNGTDPSFVLKYGTRQFIRDRVRLSNTQDVNDPYMIIINDDTNIERLAYRLFRDFKSDIETGAKIISRGDTWTGARFITENHNIHDDRLISCLRSKLTDREQTDKKMIDDLFTQCMLTVLLNSHTYKHGDVPNYKLIELCLQREADCSNMYIRYAGYPLHMSVMTDSLQLTQLLLQHGADKRRVGRDGDSVLHYVCRYTSYNRLDLIKLLTQDGDLSVVKFITSDKQTILQILDDRDRYRHDRDRYSILYDRDRYSTEIYKSVLPDREILEALDSDSLQLEEVLSDHSIKVLTTDKHKMKDYVEHSEGKIQLVRRVHDIILTHVNDEGRNILHYSVDDYDVTEYLLQHGADKRIVDNDGDSVLHRVCKHRAGSDSKHRLDIIKLLTQDGDLSVVKFITSDRRKILQILEGDIDSVDSDDRDRREILEALDSVCSDDRDRREILKALDSDSLQLEEVLSDHSIKVLTTDKHKMKDYVEHSEGKIQLVRRVHDNILTRVDSGGRNILHYSVDDYDVTEYLLQRGADKRIVDSDGDSVLHYVCEHRVCRDSKHRLDIIKLLTQDGDLSVVKFITSDRRRILQILEGHIDSVYISYRDRCEILEALDSDNLQLEEVLSDHSIKVLTTDKHQMKDYVEHSEGKIQLVIRVHDNVLTHVDSGGRNILHLSVDDYDVTEYLLQHGADKRRVNSDGDSVLHYVCKHRVCSDSKHRLDIIKLLTQDGDLSVVKFITSDRRRIFQILEGDIDSVYIYNIGRRELLEALDSGNLQLEEVLSDHSIKVLTTDKHKMKDYVEHSEGKIQLVRRVHDNILTRVDDEGRNILHYSVDDYDVTEYLLQRGADKRIVDSYGDSVLHWVCKHRVCSDSKHRLDIIKLLTQDGDLSVVKFITSDRRRILQILEGDIDSVYKYDIDSVYIYNIGRREILEALDSGNLQLEEVLSDHSIKVLTTDKHKMKDYVEHSEGKIQLVRRVHDNILTHVDGWGSNILHHSVDDYDVTEYLLQHGADKRIVDSYGDSVLHGVCKHRAGSDSKRRIDMIKLLTQDGDLSVVKFITSDKQTILQILHDRDRDSILHDRDRYSTLHDRDIYKSYLPDREILEALDSDSLQLEEVLSDHSIKVSTTDKHKMKDYVEHSEGKIQLVRRVHDNILTRVDSGGRNILHYSVDDYDVTEYLLQRGVDKRIVDSDGDSVLHYVCKHRVCSDSKHRLDIIKLLTQDGDLSVVKFITSDRRRMLQILEGDIDSVYISYRDSVYISDRDRCEILEALDSDNLQLEEVLSDHSIKVLTTDKHKMKDYVEHSEGKIQLVRRVHDNILTHVDRKGRNILHHSVDDYDLTEFFLKFHCLKLEINRLDDDNRSPYWYVVNDKKPVMGRYTKHIVIENKEDMIKLYTKHGAVL